MEEIMKDYYDNNAESYHERAMRYDSGLFLGWMKKYLWPGAYVLDVGCGSGRDLYWMTRKGFKAVGLDCCVPLLEIARDLFGGNYLEADYSEFDFSFFSVDCVTCVSSLVHIPHDKLWGIVSRIACSLKEKGFFYISLKKGKDVYRATDGRIFYLWNKDDLICNAKKYGFNVLQSFETSSSPRYSGVFPWINLVLQKC